MKLAVLIAICLGLFCSGCVYAQDAYVLHNDLDSEKWVNSTHNLIYDQPLSGYYLNKTGVRSDTLNPLLFTLYGPGITRTSTQVTHTYDRFQESYLYQDYGAGYFTPDAEIEIDFDMKESSVNPYRLWVPLAFTNDLDGWYEISGWELAITLHDGGGEYGTYIRLQELNNGALVGWDTDITTLNTNTWYYCTFSVQGGTAYLNVFSDSGRTAEVLELSVTLTYSDFSYRYLMMAQSSEIKTGSTTDPLGYSRNYVMRYPAYEEGYLITDDLLFNYTGTPFTLIYNASIPSSQGLNASISSDLVSWTLTGDHEEEGYLVSYLEPFNWTSLYIKFGFETDGIDTPILYDYHLVFYHECTDGGGGIVLSFGDLNWILTVIWLALLGIGWSNKIQPLQILGGVFGMVVGIYFLSEDTLIGLIVVFFSLALFVLSLRRSR